MTKKKRNKWRENNENEPNKKGGEKRLGRRLVFTFSNALIYSFNPPPNISPPKLIRGRIGKLAINVQTK